MATPALIAPRRSIVLLARDCHSTRVIYHALCRDFEIAQVILEGAPARWTFLKKRAARLGWRRVVGQMLFRVLAMPWLARSGRRRVQEILVANGLGDGPIPETAIVRVDSANDSATVDALRRIDPALVVVNGTRILTNDVLRSVRAPFVNVHAGITPLYRGVHGGYWALAHGDREHCGVTVHLLDEGVDTGPILGQAVVTPTPEDNFATYPTLQLAAAIPILRRVCAEVTSGGEPIPVAPPAGASRIFSHPTLAQYLTGRRTLGVR